MICAWFRLSIGFERPIATTVACQDKQNHLSEFVSKWARHFRFELIQI
jgi:hypothetical protein